MSQATARHITFSLILTIVAVMEVSSTTLPPAIPLKKDIDKGAWISDLETFIPQLMERAHVPGLSIAVIRDAEIIWTGSFGVKSNETKEAVNDTTVFQAASLSKTTFAYAVMKLVERRELDLDTPLSDYLPGRYIENDDRVKLITARMVLSHTTGFPNWRPKGGALRLYFTPGEKFSYSGEGYVYLQKVVEHITGQPLDRFMQEQVFKPLGMRHSSYEWRDEYESNHAVGHNKFAIATDRGRMRHANAAASLYTTARDYARFLVAMMRGTGLQEKSIGEMLTPQVQLESCVNCTRSKLLPSKLSEVNSWGLGWGLQTTDEGTSFWHWGDQGIFMCYTAAFKDQKLGLVYFTNSKNGLAIRNELVYRTIGGRHPAFSWLQYDSYQVLDFPGSLPTTILKEIPAAYTIPYGDIVYVENDGRCSQGKVIKITGGHGGRGIPRKYECVKRPLVQAQPPSFDFSGIWSGRGYHCVDPKPPQYVVIKIKDGDVTATKLTGDSCIEAGEVTWRGKYTGNPFPGQMSGRRPGQTFWFDVMIRIVDENTINVGGAVFTRVEVPKPSWGLQRKVPMSVLTLERLTKIAESINTEDRKVSPMQVAAILLEESLPRTLTEDRLPIDTSKPKAETTVQTVLQLATFRDRLSDGTEGPEMVKIPVGTFLMGSPDDEKGRLEREGPVHRVTFARPFAMGRYEVTVAEFGMFVKATGYRTDAERSGEGCWHVVLAKGKLRDKPTEDASWRNPYIDQTGVHPVVCVSWNDAQAYVKWLSKETGKRYRLPTEAEWEYAARANTKTAYWWGDDFKDNRANCRFCGSGWDFLKGTAPVGSFPDNPFGLSDTAGNVWEWVQDCGFQSYKGAPEDGRAWGEEDSGECGWRGDRGGSWGNSPDTLRSAFRGWDYRPHHLIGFRLAQDL